jgi:predicted hydrocarbon binding protein
VIKIPFAPKQYLKEKDPTMKRYYACHCQLVRTSIRDGEPKVSKNFCYCSAGYEKLHFDAIFGEPVEVEILESALNGDERCRFVIKIPKAKMK